MRLGVPVRVQGHELDGTPWNEMTLTENADYSGAAFVIKHPVEIGHALLLRLPLPKTFRTYDLTSASYTVYALVRNVTPIDTGYRVGVMFLGRNPPRGYAQDP